MSANASNPAVEEFLPDDHPVVTALAQHGERFTAAVPALEWSAFLGSVQQADWVAAVQSVQRDVHVTTERLVLLNGQDVRAIHGGTPSTPESFPLRDVSGVRVMRPPGSLPSWQLAVEVTVRQDGRDLIATVLVSQGETARLLAQRVELFVNQIRAMPTQSPHHAQP